MDKAKLQRPSPPPVTLNNMMRQVCHELELISQVRTGNLDSETSRLKSQSRPPAGTGKRVAEVMSLAYAECLNNWDRLMVIRKAQRIRDKSRKGGNQALRRGSPQWRRSIGTDTRASALVAKEWGISASYVRKLRQAYGSATSP